MRNASEFIRIFTKLENWMSRNLGQSNHDTFQGMVEKLEQRNKQIRHYSYFLKSMGRLRNAIVHAENYDETIIADPNDEVVNKFKLIAESIINPPKLLGHCLMKPSIISRNASLGEVLRIMQENDFSQVIIQDKDEYRLLSREGVSKWLESNISGDSVVVNNVTVAEVLEYEELDRYAYVNRGIDILSFVELISSPEKRLQAVIVTETGRMNETPLGIATLWDANEIIRTTAF